MPSNRVAALLLVFTTTLLGAIPGKIQDDRIRLQSSAPLHLHQTSSTLPIACLRPNHPSKHIPAIASMVDHKYAVFYPEHTGFLHVKRLGDDGSADLLWSIRDGKAYTRRKEVPRKWKKSAVPALEGSRHYREVAGIVRLIHAQTFKHLPAEHPSCELFWSTATISEYCNGGNLSSLLSHLGWAQHRVQDSRAKPGSGEWASFQLQTDENLEVFIWHYFDSILQTYQRLHAERKGYYKSWHINHFLQFHDGAKLPELRLGNLEVLGPLDLVYFGNELGGLFLNITSLMNRENYDPSEVEEELSLSNPKGFSRELLDCRQILGQLCQSQLYNCYHVEKVDFKEDEALAGLSLHLKLKRMDELATTVASFASRAKAGIGALPDLSGLRRDVPAIKPTLFDTRSELLSSSLKHPHSRTLSGPWFIAHVDPQTCRILAVEKTEWALHDPIIGPCGSVWIDYEFQKNLTQTGSEKLPQGDSMIELASQQDKVKGKKIVHPYFEVNPEWTESRLYPKDPTCQACSDREQAMIELTTKKTPKKRRRMTPKAKSSTKKNETRTGKTESPIKQDAKIKKMKPATPAKKTPRTKGVDGLLTAAKQQMGEARWEASTDEELRATGLDPTGLRQSRRQAGKQPDMKGF